MRKILLAVSALALPLAACAQGEEASPEPDPVVQDDGDDSDDGSIDAPEDEGAIDAEPKEAESEDEDASSEEKEAE